MIDLELSRLAGALRAAEDTLNSADFAAKQSRLVSLEQEVQDALARLDAERETLAAALENDEAAYEDAQNELTRYIALNYLSDTLSEKDDDDDFLEPIRAVPEPEDEFSTPRANGALSDA
jgi:predicted  nucleic acid-binding Zn-ribbon protein